MRQRARVCLGQGLWHLVRVQGHVAVCLGLALGQRQLGSEELAKGPRRLMPSGPFQQFPTQP